MIQSSQIMIYYPMQVINIIPKDAHLKGKLSE